MKETTLNGFLSNSFNDYFTHMDCIKYHGGRFGISGMPDLIGTFLGLNFAVEGKMLKEAKSKNKRYLIAKRDGNISGCSDVQNDRMNHLQQAGTLVMLGYYKHFGKKGVYLIPRIEITTDEEFKDFMIGNDDGIQYDRYFCPYVKGRLYDIKDVFNKELKAHYNWNRKNYITKWMR